MDTLCTPFAAPPTTKRTIAGISTAIAAESPTASPSTTEATRNAGTSRAFGSFRAIIAAPRMRPTIQAEASRPYPHPPAFSVSVREEHLRHVVHRREEDHRAEDRERHDEQAVAADHAEAGLRLALGTLLRDPHRPAPHRERERARPRSPRRWRVDQQGHLGPHTRDRGEQPGQQGARRSCPRTAPSRGRRCPRWHARRPPRPGRACRSPGSPPRWPSPAGTPAGGCWASPTRTRVRAPRPPGRRRPRTASASSRSCRR